MELASKSLKLRLHNTVGGITNITGDTGDFTVDFILIDNIWYLVPRITAPNIKIIEPDVNALEILIKLNENEPYKGNILKIQGNKNFEYVEPADPVLKGGKKEEVKVEVEKED
jgi:hypothetical protein